MAAALYRHWRLVVDESAVFETQHAVAIGQTLVTVCDHHDGRPRIEIDHAFEDFVFGRDVATETGRSALFIGPIAVLWRGHFLRRGHPASRIDQSRKAGFA